MGLLQNPSTALWSDLKSATSTCSGPEVTSNSRAVLVNRVGDPPLATSRGQG
jgi:hypothetical protein